LTIRQVCDELSVTLRALRFYEAQGLVAPKREPRRRFYYTTDVERLRAIMRLKSVRLSLREIRELLQHRAMELWADRQLVRASSGLACSAPGQKQGSRFLLMQVVGARHELRPSWRPRRHLAQPLALDSGRDPARNRAMPKDVLRPLPHDIVAPLLRARVTLRPRH